MLFLCNLFTEIVVYFNSSMSAVSCTIVWLGFVSFTFKPMKLHLPDCSFNWNQCSIFTCFAMFYISWYILFCSLPAVRHCNISFELVRKKNTSCSLKLSLFSIWTFAWHFAVAFSNRVIFSPWKKLDLWNKREIVNKGKAQKERAEPILPAAQFGSIDKKRDVFMCDSSDGR